MKTKLFLIAAVVTAISATNAMAGGYKPMMGGNTQFAGASASNHAIQTARGKYAVNVTGAAALALNLNNCGCFAKNDQTAIAEAKSQSYQSAKGYLAINASGALAAAVNVNGGGIR